MVDAACWPLAFMRQAICACHWTDKLPICSRQHSWQTQKNHIWNICRTSGRFHLLYNKKNVHRNMDPKLESHRILPQDSDLFMSEMIAMYFNSAARCIRIVCEHLCKLECVWSGANLNRCICILLLSQRRYWLPVVVTWNFACTATLQMVAPLWSAKYCSVKVSWGTDLQYSTYM